LYVGAFGEDTSSITVTTTANEYSDYFTINRLESGVSGSIGPEGPMPDTSSFVKNEQTSSWEEVAIKVTAESAS